MEQKIKIKFRIALIIFKYFNIIKRVIINI